MTDEDAPSDSSECVVNFGDSEKIALPIHPLASEILVELDSKTFTETSADNNNLDSPHVASQTSLDMFDQVTAEKTKQLLVWWGFALFLLAEFWENYRVFLYIGYFLSIILLTL